MKQLAIIITAIYFSYIINTIWPLANIGKACCNTGITGSMQDSTPKRLRFTPAEIKIILRLANLTPPNSDPTNRFVDNARAARFGQYLFFDRRLSQNGEVSCATCHNPQTGWTEAKSFSKGIELTTRHTPTLWNIAYNRWYFWDGRADTLWSQALFPLEAAGEMGITRLQIAYLIYRDPNLKTAYEEIFGALPDLNDQRRFPPLTANFSALNDEAWQKLAKEDQLAINRLFTNIGKAIAAFESKIISQDSPFDRFVANLNRTDETTTESLSYEAQRGLQLFIGKAKCISCHFGANFSDGEFHNTGLTKDRQYPDHGRYDGIDLLLKNPFNASSQFSDSAQSTTAERLKYLKNGGNYWGAFKTPTLRNIAETAPYMHDGRFATLSEVIEHYSTLKDALVSQNGEQVLEPLYLSKQEIQELVEFLKSLTGRPLDAHLMISPERP